MNYTIKRIIILCSWLLTSTIYVWLLSDIGRSLGAKIKLIHDGNTVSLSNVVESYKFNFGAIAVLTIIYFVITIMCYHFAFIHKKERKGD